MPIIKSAKKRVRTSNKATIRNAKTKRIVRETVKDLKKAIADGKSKDVLEKHAKAVSAIDTAAKKNVMHKNKAARKKSQLSSALKTAGVSPTKSAKKASPAKKPSKSTPKKPATKKPVAKKSVAKKPATKKASK